MTLLIASAFARTVQELRTLVGRAGDEGVGVIEARVDTFGEDPARLNGFLRKCADQIWLITCRSKSEGGFFPGDSIDAARWAGEAVQGTNAWIDIELAAWRASGELRTQLKRHLDANPTARLLISAHFLDAMPANLASVVDEALREGPQVIAKVAYRGEHISDSFEALDLMHRYGPRVIAICMGEAGAWTRVLARKLDSFATFAALPGSASTAPGQWTVQELRENFDWERIGEHTQVFGVAGDPVAHSLSPRLFNHWFKQHNIDAVFLPFRVGADRGGLSQFLAKCTARPWLNMRGMSVTIPHKVEAMKWAGDAADPMSRGIGAANTLVLGDAGRAAYNTDCYAAVDSLAAALGRRRNELAGLAVDVLGTGGAARAVCYGLAEMGCRVTAFARTPRETDDFEHWGVAVRAWPDRVQSTGEIVVNCTPVGMWPNIAESPMPVDALRGRKLVFDLIYRPLETRLLKDAIVAGCRTLGGLDMFVRQAATQFALWTGQTSDMEGAFRMLEMWLECDSHRTTLRNGVALIGARGSGKTTVGRLLAGLLGVRHVDIDELVISASGKSIRQIFAENGEEEFRRLESEALSLSAATVVPQVISMGGGAVMDLANISQVARVARIVWLAAPVDVLVERMAGDTKSPENRPSLTKHDALTEMQEVLRIREPLYRAAADFIVDTSHRESNEVARRIAEWIEHCMV